MQARLDRSTALEIANLISGSKLLKWEKNPFRKEKRMPCIRRHGKWGDENGKIADRASKLKQSICGLGTGSGAGSGKECDEIRGFPVVENKNHA